MRKIHYMEFIAAAFMAAACAKESGVVDGAPRMIAIEVGDEIAMTNDTKATAVTTLPSSLYWGMTTGTAGSDTRKTSSASGAVSSSKINTGVYQTSPATSYNYYVSNVNMTVPASGAVTISASNTTDIVAGVCKASTSLSPSVTLNHIFARTGSLTLNNKSGMDSVTGVSWKIESSGTSNTVAQGGTAATYNVSTATFTTPVTRLAQQDVTSSSDLYLLPGTYKFIVTYTLNKDDYHKTYTRWGTATLQGGKINNISATATGDDVEPIQISVSLTPWGDPVTQTVSTLVD